MKLCLLFNIYSESTNYLFDSIIHMNIMLYKKEYLGKTEKSHIFFWETGTEERKKDRNANI